MSQPYDADPPPVAGADERTLCLIIYILFLAPLGGVTHLIGLILAYAARERAPYWLTTHYTYLIRTFWLGLAWFIVALPLCLLLVGLAMLPLIFLWFVARCAVGMLWLYRFQPVPRPYSLLL